jgi:hypothetical protein
MIAARTQFVSSLLHCTISIAQLQMILSWAQSSWHDQHQWVMAEIPGAFMLMRPQLPTALGRVAGLRLPDELRKGRGEQREEANTEVTGQRAGFVCFF